VFVIWKLPSPSSAQNAARPVRPHRRSSVAFSRNFGLNPLQSPRKSVEHRTARRMPALHRYNRRDASDAVDAGAASVARDSLENNGNTPAACSASAPSTMAGGPCSPPPLDPIPAHACTTGGEPRCHHRHAIATMEAASPRFHAASSFTAAAPPSLRKRPALRRASFGTHLGRRGRACRDHERPSRAAGYGPCEDEHLLHGHRQRRVIAERDLTERVADQYDIHLRPRPRSGRANNPPRSP